MRRERYRESPVTWIVYVQLLANEAFRSLAIAIRLVYQKKEPANFYSVWNILARKAPSDVAERVSTLRRRYGEILSDSAGDVGIDDGQNPGALKASEVFEHWLYGMTFHQDEDRQAAVRRLASAGARFYWSVQASVLQMAGRVLDLDDVIAELLGETRLPRIGDSAPAA